MDTRAVDNLAFALEYCVCIEFIELRVEIAIEEYISEQY